MTATSAMTRPYTTLEAITMTSAASAAPAGAAAARRAKLTVVAVLDADDQHDHQPDLEGVERAVRAERAVRQHRQDDERDQHELHDRRDVTLPDAGGECMQRILEVQKDRDHAAQGDGNREFAHHRIGADAKQEERRDLGRLPGVVLAATRHHEVADDEERRDGDESRRDDPAAVVLRKPAADRPERRDERERADAADGGFRALPLQADQEAEEQRDADLAKEL
jgi:hypothetical protein